jgi:hypothetical protein
VSYGDISPTFYEELRQFVINPYSTYDTEIGEQTAQAYENACYQQRLESLPGAAGASYNSYGYVAAVVYGIESRAKSAHLLAARSECV